MKNFISIPLRFLRRHIGILILAATIGLSPACAPVFYDHDHPSHYPHHHHKPPKPPKHKHKKEKHKKHKPPKHKKHHHD